MIPKNKDELISEIKKHFTTLRKDLEIFPAKLANRKELEWQKEIQWRNWDIEKITENLDIILWNDILKLKNLI